MSDAAPARFAAGDRVRVHSVDPAHHTRAPQYVRGHEGVVVEPQGSWPLADDRARGVPDPRVEPVYTVRFSARDLWGEEGHSVTVDLWQSYLEPVTEVEP
jgi:anaerobic selenocysteine-containing dehydrogenase